MSEQNYEVLNDLSVSMENLTVMMGIVEDMVSNLAFGEVKDEDQYTRTLFSLVNGVKELLQKREVDIDNILQTVEIRKAV